MERREPGLFGTLFAFGSPLLVGLLVMYESIEGAGELTRFWLSPSTVYLSPQVLNLFPLAIVVLGWLGLAAFLQIVAWFMNGRGTLFETLETVGRMVGMLGGIEALRLGGVLNGINEWAGLAWFCMGAVLVLGWTGRAWGKLHLLSRRETLVVTLVCFYGPVPAWVVLKGYAVMAVLEIARHLWDR